VEKLNKLTATPVHISSAVKEFLVGAGATCSAPTGDAFKCTAPVSVVEGMLKTEMHQYRHKETGKLVHRVDEDYTFPAELDGT
jgi:hypothetical protein